jgi:hypothetical protein
MSIFTRKITDVDLLAEPAANIESVTFCCVVYGTQYFTSAL